MRHIYVAQLEIKDGQVYSLDPSLPLHNPTFVVTNDGHHVAVLKMGEGSLKKDFGTALYIEENLMTKEQVYEVIVKVAQCLMALQENGR